MEAFAIPFLLFVGALLAVQAAANVQLSTATGSPFGASTLQLGIGAIPNAAAAALRGRRDLGVHTELFSDGVVDLVETGAITGARKNLHRGKIVSSFVSGSMISAGTGTVPRLGSGSRTPGRRCRSSFSDVVDVDGDAGSVTSHVFRADWTVRSAAAVPGHRLAVYNGMTDRSREPAA